MKIRVLKFERNDNIEDPDKRTTTYVYWEGEDVVALSKQYPRSEIMGADPLGFASIEDGWISWYFHFEKLDESGKWIECRDPRIRLHSELSELEAAIDDENRRLFPGDFIDDDSDDDSGYCPPELADDDPACFEGDDE